MTNIIQLKDKLQFQETPLEIYDIDGNHWLKSSDLAVALGYQGEDGVRRIYDRYKDEFAADMTRPVKLTDRLGRENTYRVFSPRGCHIIAMLSHTKRAKLFRKWVLDVLETYGQDVKPQQEITPPTFYAKTMLADGTDSEVATRNQVKHLIGSVSAMTKKIEHLQEFLEVVHDCARNHTIFLDILDKRMKNVDEKIRVFAVDSDSLAKLDLVMGSTLEVVMREKSYKNRVIQCLKEENAKLRQTVQVMTHNTAWATA